MSAEFNFENNSDQRDACEIGSKFLVVLEFGEEDDAGVFTPDDLTGIADSARMQVRKEHGSETVLLEFKKSDSSAVLVPAIGELTLFQGATVTDDLIAACNVYDIELYLEADPDEVTREMEGVFVITNEVTRPIT